MAFAYLPVAWSEKTIAFGACDDIFAWQDRKTWNSLWEEPFPS